MFSSSTGDIHLVRIRSFPEYSCSLPADYRLSRLCTGTVQIHYVDGSHESMMQSPQVEAVIAAVQTALKASHCWTQWLVGVGVLDVTLVTVHCGRWRCLVGVGLLDVTLVTVHCGRWRCLVGVGLLDVTLVTMPCRRWWCLLAVGVLDVTLVTMHCRKCECGWW